MNIIKIEKWTDEKLIENYKKAIKEENKENEEYFGELLIHKWDPLCYKFSHNEDTLGRLRPVILKCAREFKPELNFKFITLLFMALKNEFLRKESLVNEANRKEYNEEKYEYEQRTGKIFKKNIPQTTHYFLEPNNISVLNQKSDKDIFQEIQKEDTKKYLEKMAKKLCLGDYVVFCHLGGLYNFEPLSKKEILRRYNMKNSKYSTIMHRIKHIFKNYKVVREHLL